MSTVETVKSVIRPRLSPGQAIDAAIHHGASIYVDGDEPYVFDHDKSKYPGQWEWRRRYLDPTSLKPTHRESWSATPFDLTKEVWDSKLELYEPCLWSRSPVSEAVAASFGTAVTPTITSLAEDADLSLEVCRGALLNTDSYLNQLFRSCNQETIERLTEQVLCLAQADTTYRALLHGLFACAPSALSRDKLLENLRAAGVLEEDREMG